MTKTPAGRALRALGTASLAAFIAGSAHAAVEAGAGEGVLGTVRTVEETRVRSRPSSMGRSLGLVLAGREFELLAEEGAWSQVTDGAKVAWLRSSALSRVVVPEVAEVAADEPAATTPVRPPVVDPPPPAPPARVSSTAEPRRTVLSPAPSAVASRRPATASAAGERRVSGRWVRSPRVLGLRGFPSFAEGLVGIVNESDSVRVLERRGGWGRVEARNGREGWIVLAALDGPLVARR